MALRLARARSHGYYRLFFSGQSLSLVGTWITRVAIGWLVYRLTGSQLLLGIVSFAGPTPALLLAPFASVAVDRHNRHRILDQAASLLQSVVLAVLTRFLSGGAAPGASRYLPAWGRRAAGQRRGLD